ncbi:hypothetical protein L7F22_057139 [Adiantum nelumboides]|nr:hypothetical protein [Adiantum nelumboides]
MEENNVDENPSAKKKKLKRDQRVEEEEAEPFSDNKRQKKLKKKRQSSREEEEEEETSVKKKSRVIAFVERSSAQKRTKRLTEDGKLALSNDEGKDEMKPRQKKRRRKKKKNKDTSALNDRMEDPHLENGVHAEGLVKTGNVSFRLLVPSKEVGKVIGKQGDRIQRLREETDAHIKIGDAIVNLEERVIWIASKEDTLTSTSAAERALLSVVTLLIRPENEDQELAKIRLLVTGSQAKVFRKGGKMLENISDETGAVVSIFGKDKFPLLAFASQSDMLVQVEGKTFEVQQALELVVTRLRECLQKTRNVERFKDKTASGVFKTAVQISIPSDHIGRLIGKDGSTLRQIKEQCRVSIEVLNNVEHGGQGKIAHLRGSLAQVTMAQTLLQTFLASKRKAK